MENTRNAYVADGLTDIFSITFNFLKNSEIRATINGVFTTNFVFVSSNEIQFLSVPADGDTVELFRETDDTKLAATLSQGSTIRSSDLNANFNQAINLIQEVNSNTEDAFAEASDIFTTIDADLTAVTATANAALPKAGGTMTGNIVFAAGQPTATTSTKGIVQLTDSTTSTSVTTAATPNAVKTAKDVADAALPKAGGTMTGAITLPADPTLALQASTKQYVDTVAGANVGNSLLKTGGTMTGPIVFDATQAKASTTGYGITQLTDSTTSTSITTAATPAAVKVAKDAADAAQATATAALPKSGGTMTGVLNFDLALQTKASTSTYGITQLTNSTTSTDTGTAATAASAKAAADLAHAAQSTANTANTTANAALPKAGGTMTGNLEIGTAGSLTFEGATADGFETTLAAVDPTADRTITLPNVSGTVVTSGDTGTVTSTMILDDTIVNGDINSSAAIVDTKLATIATAGKVSNSATTAASANTPSAIVARDASGNFSASTITAALTGAASSNVLKAGDTMTGVLSITAGTASLPGIAVSGDANTGIYSPGADQVGISTGGTGRVFVDGSGNVGIGGAAANYVGYPNLRINGSTGGIIDLSNNGTSVFRLTADTTGAFYYTQNTSYPHVWGAGATERMRIDSSGNVGIGVTPSTWGTNFRALELQYSSGASVFAGLYPVIAANTYNDNTNYIYKTSAAASYYSQVTGTHRWYTAPSGTAGTAISFTQAMTLDASGRLGIGTTSPSMPLQVLNAGTGNNTNNGAITLCRTGTVGSTLYHMYSTAVSDEAFAFSVHGGTTFSNTTYTKYLASAGGVHIWYGTTTSAERMRINSSGNVGIGTSSPSSGLHLANPTTGAAANFTLSNPANNWSIVTGTTANSLSFVDNQFSANRLHIGASGVGIGTTSTSAILHTVSAESGILGTNIPGNIYIESNTTAAAGVGGGIVFGGAQNGTTTTVAAGIKAAKSNGTAGDYGFDLAFYTRANLTAGSEKLRITSDGKMGLGTTSPGSALEINAAASTSPFIVKINTVEHARVDSSGRLLVGTSSASVTCRAVFQGHQADNTASTDVYFQNGTAAASVLSGNALGTLSFAASGSRGAYITTVADANWTASSFPAHIQFATVASGSTSPTERLRITNDGVMCHDQPAPATYAAAATLTVADLKTGIITYTGGAATLTLPTGTLTEGGFAGIYTNMTFEWSVINTGAGICTIGAGTAHTIVGSGSVAIGASARFTSRRTAANTFISYRLS